MINRMLFFLGLIVVCFQSCNILKVGNKSKVIYNQPLNDTTTRYVKAEMIYDVLKKSIYKSKIPMPREVDYFFCIVEDNQEQCKISSGVTGHYIQKKYEWESIDTTLHEYLLSFDTTVTFNLVSEMPFALDYYIKSNDFLYSPKYLNS